jgi:hypothetical protein
MDRRRGKEQLAGSHQSVRSKVDVSLGPDGWQLPIVAGTPINGLFSNLRRGYAFGESSSCPGAAFHGAVCRAAGVDPMAPGVLAAAGHACGFKNRQNYHQFVNVGSVEAAAKAAARLGFYFVSIPSPSGLKYVVGDVPLDVTIDPV